MGAYNIDCPHCGGVLEIQDEWAEMEMPCPLCGKNFIAPRREIPIPPRAAVSVRSVTERSQAGETSQSVRQDGAGASPPRSADPALVVPAASGIPAKSRAVYIALGIFLGHLGISDFYAGYMARGFIKLGLTLLCLGTFASACWTYADLFTIKNDINGNPFV